MFVYFSNNRCINVRFEYWVAPEDYVAARVMLSISVWTLRKLSHMINVWADILEENYETHFSLSLSLSLSLWQISPLVRMAGTSKHLFICVYITVFKHSSYSWIFNKTPIYTCSFKLLKSSHKRQTVIFLNLQKYHLFQIILLYFSISCQHFIRISSMVFF